MEPHAQVGIRGSIVSGIKGPHKLGPNGERLPFNPNDFDLDVFIVSDKLSEGFPKKQFSRSGTKIPEIKNIQKSIESKLLDSEIFYGLRKNDEFTFRIWKSSEIKKKLDMLDSQLFFLEK